jgi:Fic-DOC domain mobile mystery protein B
MKFVYPMGATPLTQDEIHNLIPKHLTSQDQLNEYEQYNITLGQEWAFKHKRKDILKIEFAKLLHTKLFDKTWTWAGKFRKHQTNIGVESIQITIELKKLFDDVKYWQQHETFNVREIAARLSYKLVFIHPFPNGNGRFSRLFADVFLYNNNEPLFTWGERKQGEKYSRVNGKKREENINALRAADQHDYLKWLLFVDS